MNIVLCQDCGNVETFSHDKHNCLVQCSCGGDFCGCPSCQLDGDNQMQKAAEGRRPQVGWPAA